MWNFSSVGKKPSARVCLEECKAGIPICREHPKPPDGYRLAEGKECLGPSLSAYFGQYREGQVQLEGDSGVRVSRDLERIRIRFLLPMVFLKDVPSRIPAPLTETVFPSFVGKPLQELPVEGSRLMVFMPAYLIITAFYSVVFVIVLLALNGKRGK